MIHEGTQPPTDDIKDMMIAGCQFRLAYERSLKRRMDGERHHYMWS